MATWIKIDSAHYNKDAIDSIVIDTIGAGPGSAVYIQIHLRNDQDLRIGPYANVTAAAVVRDLIIASDTVIGPYTS